MPIERAILCLVFLLLSPLLVSVSHGTTRLKIQGSTTVNPVVAEASGHFRTNGWQVIVDTQGGSSGGISALAEGLADLAMSSKPVSEEDRKKYPNIKFVEHPIGYDGVGIAVSKEIFEGGVTVLSRSQLRDIYEGKITRWKAVGGPDKPIVFFNKEPGRGTWEVFVHFLYGDPKKAPPVTHPEVGGNEEGRTKVSRHTSAITQLSLAWVLATPSLSAIAIKDESGKIHKPELNSVRGNYPLKRTLLLVSNGPLSGPSKEFVDYILSPSGQSLVEKHGYLSLKPVHP